MPVRAQLPADQAKGRLVVRFRDGEGAARAYEFLDVELG
jgi:hypothetical protein